MTHAYTNDKYSANTTSIFVPAKYREEIEQIIEYQNTQQGDNGEFIAAIETTFSFDCADEPEQYDMMLLTIQEYVYKDVAKQLFDTDTLLALLLDTENPVQDDDVCLRSACEKQNLGNIWFNRDWLLPVPLEIHWAAKTFAANSEADLLYIKPVGSSNNLWNACFQKEDGEIITTTYSLQTKTVNTVVEHMFQSSAKGVIRQNW